MTEGEEGEDDRGEKARMTEGEKARMTEGKKDDGGGKGGKDGGGKEGEASWCTKDFFVWYCWLMGRLGWGIPGCRRLACYLGGL